MEDDDDDHGDSPEFEKNELDHDEKFKGVPGRRLSCFPHTLQLVVCLFNKNKAVQEALTDARAMVKSVNSSSVATQLLVSLCHKKLVSGVPTRWGSTYQMLKRLLDVAPSIGKRMTW